ncbi:MAG: hypothetical protein ACFFDH_09450 [Promethearchaeota archaeon]
MVFSYKYRIVWKWLGLIFWCHYGFLMILDAFILFRIIYFANLNGGSILINMNLHGELILEFWFLFFTMLLSIIGGCYLIIKKSREVIKE